MADAESGPGYLTVPQRYEERFDARLEEFVARQRQKARERDLERARAGEDDGAEAGHADSAHADSAHAGLQASAPSTTREGTVR